MESEDGRRGEKDGKPTREDSLLHRFKEAWTWYREDWKTAAEDAPKPEDQERLMSILGIVFLVGLSLLAVAKGWSVLSIAMPLALAALIYVQDKLGRSTGSPSQWKRATNWMQAVVLLLMLILLASDILPKHF